MFQRHVNDDEHFNRTWAEYKNGFGELTSNFWLGNEHIHRLTRNVQELLLDLDSVNGDHTFILYKSFQVESEETFYTLHVSEYQQSVGNCMNYFDGMKFSTADEDHDRKGSINCAEVRKAGWWFRGCTNCHLNGLFDPNEGDGQRFKMENWQDNQYLDWSEIKLRNKEGELWIEAWYGTARHGMVWYGMVLYGMVRYGMVRYGTVRYGIVRYGTVWYGTVRYGTVRHGMVRYGTVWYSMV